MGTVYVFFADGFEEIEAFSEFQVHLNVNADSLKAADKLSGKGHTK